MEALDRCKDDREDLEGFDFLGAIGLRGQVGHKAIGV